MNQAVEDEIVALFGIPASHEDDDLRAVRAALELHAHPFATEAGLPTGSVVLRSGVHAGPIVAQRLNDGQRRYGVTGDGRAGGGANCGHRAAGFDSR